LRGLRKRTATTLILLTDGLKVINWVLTIDKGRHAYAPYCTTRSSENTLATFIEDQIQIGKILKTASE
jgi:hypothetical protein